MQKNLTPRYFIILLIFLWAIYSLLPTWEYENMSEADKEILLETGELEQIESRIIRQGLDLKGGMYIVLEVDIPTLIKNKASKNGERLDEKLDSIINNSQENSTNQNIDFFTAFEENVVNNGIQLSRYYHNYGASLEKILDALKEESDDA